MEGSRVEEDKPSGAKTSGSSPRYRGVGWNKRGKKWQVRITVNGKMKSLGYFADEIAAARAYDAFVIAKKINKPLNFPDGAAAKGHVVTSSKSSRFRGVCWNKRGKKWLVTIYADGKKKNLGSFAEEIAAARAYDAFVIAKKLNKPLNFPGEAAAKGHVVILKQSKKLQALLRKAAKKISNFRGVWWHTTRQKWQALMNDGGTCCTIGVYDDEVEAARAYDAYAVANSIDTPPNFPNENEDNMVAEAARVRPALKKRKKTASKTSRFRGVSRNESATKWQVNIQVGE